MEDILSVSLAEITSFEQLAANDMKSVDFKEYLIPELFMRIHGVHVAGKMTVSFWSGVAIKSKLPPNYQGICIWRPDQEQQTLVGAGHQFDFGTEVLTKENTYRLSAVPDYRKVLNLFAWYGPKVITSEQPLVLCLALTSLYDTNCVLINQDISKFSDYSTEIQLDRFIVVTVRDSLAKAKVFSQAVADKVPGFDYLVHKDTVQVLTNTNSMVRMTQSEAHFFYFCVLSCMSKGLSESQHFLEWRRKRVQAWENLGGSKIREEVMPTIDDARRLKELATTLSPIRSLMFQALISSRATFPNRSHVLNLLKYSNMTNVTILLSFVKTPEKTEAHFLDYILSEITTFVNKYNLMKKKLGEMYPYFKVMYPDAQDFSHNSLPNLSYAAKSFVKLYRPREMREYRFSSVTCENSIEIDAALKTTVRLGRGRGKRMPEKYRSVLEEMGVDLEEYNRYVAANDD